MGLSIVGQYRSFNQFCAVFCIVLVAHSLFPGAAEAKKKRRKQLKPYIVRDITVDTRNVFDPTVPGEDFWLFRLANFLHIETRDSVIRRELLERPGHRTDIEQIAESERNLRALPFIKDASVTPQFNPDGTVDLHARTQDSWTTQPQFNISSQGGQTTYSAGFEELNLLGYGKDISYFYKKDVYGITHSLGYNDPQFLNTRLRLTSAFSDTPTGNVQDITIQEPFYSLTTRNSAGIVLNHSKALQRVFTNGVQNNQYDQDHLNFNPFIGRWLNNDPLNVVRAQLSYRYSKDIFHAQDITLPGTLPDNKALSGPIVTTSFIQSDFIKETFADKTGRVEDINLGHQSALGVGYVGRDFGATENSIPFSFNDSFGFDGNGPWFGLVSYGMTSRYFLYQTNQNGGRLVNTLYFANLNYYRHVNVNFPMVNVAHAESAYVQNPDVANILSLGGDSGLRGFANNSFTGNKSILVNFENRFFYPQEVLHLVYIGGAVFTDAGEVQTEGTGYTTRAIHMDVGAGFRFGLSRSADGTVFRVDLAYAIGPIQQSNRWIISISSSQGFGRDSNTYKNYGSAAATQ